MIKDELGMIKDEWRVMKDDDFKLLRGFTERWTDICKYVVAFATEKIFGFTFCFFIFS